MPTTPHGRRQLARRRLAAAITAAALLAPLGAIAAPVAIDIQPQPLQAALNALATQSGLQVIYDGALVSGLSSPGLAGQMEPEQALSQLLAGSGLSYRFTGTNTVVLAPGGGAAAKAQPGGDSGGPVQLGPLRVVSAAGYEQKITDAPASISVVTQEDLQQKRYSNLAQALEDVEGIDVRQRGEVGALCLHLPQQVQVHAAIILRRFGKAGFHRGLLVGDVLAAGSQQQHAQWNQQQTGGVAHLTSPSRRWTAR